MATDEDDMDREDRVYMHGVSWKLYLELDRARHDSSKPRLSYLDGELEFMSPGLSHDTMSRMFTRLLGVYAEERGIELNAAGSWTVQKKVRKAGCEADECFYIGRIGRRKRPSLSIEVEWSRGGIDKLEIYRRLGVAEVWRWRNGEVLVYVLRRRAGKKVYVRSPRSKLLPRYPAARSSCRGGESDRGGAPLSPRAAAR
jgi:Uma2 family endonuclease